MRRFWGWTLGCAGALLLAMALTLPTPVGFALWHYNVAFAAILLAGGLAWPLLTRRRIATLAMAFTGVAATATGFVMLYSKDLLHKEWITWWHSVTSVGLMLAFLVHWLLNRTRLWDFTRRLFARSSRPALLVTGAWAGAAVAGAWTWSDPAARAMFRDENYQYLASWAVLGAVLLAYAPWLAYRPPRLRARLDDVDHRNAARALVDTSLFLSHWGAIVTGFALVWWAEPLRGGDLKYVSKWWHTATSVAFLGLVALHIGFNARLLAAHARRVDTELAR